MTGATARREWVDAWRDAVRASPHALGLVEIPSTHFLELSSAAAGTLGTTRDAGLELEYLAIVEPREAAERSARLLASGAVDSVHSRRRLRRPDESSIEVAVSGRTIRSADGAAIGLMVLGEATETTDPATVATGIVDYRWRVVDVSTDVDEVLGLAAGDVIGASIIELTHPRDETDLLLAFARATSKTRTTVRVRMRHRTRTWQDVTAAVTALDDPLPRFVFALAIDDAQPSSELARVIALERSLERIAAEVHAAGVWRIGDPGADPMQVPALSGLSSRQWEVASRLARGERVAAIASALYLSQSTVRNHLSVIFRKVGVHSQQELLALLRRRD